MIPPDKAKEDSATAQPSSGKVWDTVALVTLLGLVLSASVMFWKLLSTERVQAMTAATAVPTKTKIVSTRDLEAYTLIKDKDLTFIKGTETSDPNALKALLDKSINRYLLVEVLPGAEVRSEMLAPPEATALLGNSVAVSLPATAASTLGSQLRAGDMIDLLAIPSGQPSDTPSDKAKLHVFEQLMVLNVPINKDPKVDVKNVADNGATTLALPANRRDEFASALAGAAVVITRRISVK